MPKTPLEQDLKSLRLNVKAAMLISNSLISQKSLLKVIDDTYEDLLLTPKDKRKELTTYLYDKFMTKYGLKRVAQRNIIRLMSTCLKFKDSPKIRLFSRFMKLYNSLDREDMLFYLDYLEFIRTIKKKGYDYQDDKVEEVKK
jgi:hypothetical protein